ncbi:hypothetical protein [Rhodohalobacter sp. 8-1]|uniref:hypothetical protein n=1 Tax=Rhodohalobacter sp. 8-1 TaxID=3131972 RepID=UPI0030ECCC50
MNNPGKQLQESFAGNAARTLGYFHKCMITELKDVRHGMIILEISYPDDTELERVDRVAALQYLFAEPMAPDFWEITFVHMVEYHTTGPGGYMGMCGNIFYDQGRGYVEGESSFARHYFTDRLYDTGDLYEILCETEID